MGYPSILSTIYIFLVLLFDFLVSGWCGKGVFRLSIIYFLFCTPTNKYVLRKTEVLRSSSLVMAWKFFFSETDLYLRKSQKWTKYFLTLAHVRTMAGCVLYILFHLEPAKMSTMISCNSLQWLCEALNLSTEARTMRIQIFPLPLK